MLRWLEDTLKLSAIFKFCLRDDPIKALDDSIPGVGDVGDGVPGHGAELDDDKHEGQNILLPPECRAESKD